MLHFYISGATEGRIPLIFRFLCPNNVHFPEDIGFRGGKAFAVHGPVSVTLSPHGAFRYESSVKLQTSQLLD